MSEKEKLVRDKHADDPWPGQHYRIASDNELPGLLNNKVVEETGEFLAAVDGLSTDETKIAKEAGDAMEAIQARAKLAGVSPESIEKIRRKTKKERGGFEKGIILIEEI